MFCLLHRDLAPLLKLLQLVMRSTSVDLVMFVCVQKKTFFVCAGKDGAFCSKRFCVGCLESYFRMYSRPSEGWMCPVTMGNCCCCYETGSCTCKNDDPARPQRPARSGHATCCQTYQRRKKRLEEKQAKDAAAAAKENV